MPVRAALATGVARGMGKQRRRDVRLHSEAVAEVSGEFIVMRKPFELSEVSRTTARMIAASKQPASSNVVRLRDARRGQT